MSVLSDNTAPRVAFTGMPIQYQKDLKFAFSDYVEAYKGTDNTSRPRSVACIVLFSVGNATGSWQLFKISSRARVWRTNMVKMMTSGLIVGAMNAIAKEEVEAMGRDRGILKVGSDQQSADNEEEGDEETPNEVPAEIHSDVQQELQPEIQPESPEETKEEHHETVEKQIKDEGEGQPSVTTRLGREIRHPTQYLAVTKLSKQDWKENEADKAIKAELMMLFKDLKVLRAVKRASIKAGTKILKSHMFIVTKYLASGEFDKMKAQLVADGRDQDPELYPNKSSLTVALQSVFTVLGLVSHHKWRVTMKIDIKGAFLQTPMEGEPTYMKLNQKMMRYVIEMFPELKKYIEEDDCLYTLMLKAIYGCVQASALWYALIRRTLEEGGYELSETDRCGFWKTSSKSRIYLLLLHVDVILANVAREEAMALKAQLEKVFGTIQFEEGGRLSYLGMQLELCDEGTIVDMLFYAKQLLEGNK
jgi:flagellar motor protein MotB